MTATRDETLAVAVRRQARAFGSQVQPKGVRRFRVMAAAVPTVELEFRPGTPGATEGALREMRMHHDLHMNSDTRNLLHQANARLVIEDQGVTAVMEQWGICQCVGVVTHVGEVYDTSVRNGLTDEAFSFNDHNVTEIICCVYTLYVHSVRIV